MTERDRMRTALAGAMDLEEAERWQRPLCLEERALNFDYAGRVVDVLVQRGWRIVKEEARTA